MTNLDKAYFCVQPAVAEALSRNQPIVALESTVITHGLPYPENIQLARDVEAEITKLGCIPATIAIIEGKVCIGIDESQLAHLVSIKNLVKVSVRDIAPAIQNRKSGGTTVAGTLVIAQAAGIQVFATGGIGGVHRGSLYDVSADLAQLAKSRLVVVCAGAKAILDIPATLEVLETSGVPVIGYQTDEFPAFYSTSSGMPVSGRVDSGEEAAELALRHWDLGLKSAILLAVPPPEEVALEREMVESAIRVALEEAQTNQIHGQAVTPYLLSRVSELTGGKSLEANLALLKNNARVAAEVAKSMTR
jgi:pseudouridine-5'-phosphate glycosidase